MSARTTYQFGELMLRLNDRDLRVLEDLERFRLLDTRLVQRLQFPVGAGGPHLSSSSATRTTTRVLGRLEGHGFIARVGRRVGGSGYGSSQTVWQLAATGERLLRARRGETGRRRYVSPGAGFIDHTLEVARYAATLIELSRVGEFELLDLQTEPDAWRPFQAAQGGATVLKPDLYVVTADTQSETHSFIEIDRATEHMPAILRKCRTYDQYVRTGAEQAAHDLFPAVVWVAPDFARAAKIAGAIGTAAQLDPHLFHATTAETSLSVVAPYSSPNPKGGINS